MGFVEHIIDLSSLSLLLKQYGTKNKDKYKGNIKGDSPAMRERSHIALTLSSCDIVAARLL
jgi:hypothetical protein